MILAGCLLAVAMVTARFGPMLLAQYGLSARSPLAAVAAWQIASWSVVLGVTLATGMLAFPGVVAVGHLPADLEACLVVLRHASGGGAELVRWPAAGVFAALVTRLAISAATGARHARKRRALHLVALACAGRVDGELGVRVVENDEPVVYCLPGHSGVVVFTSAALQRLTRLQRRAVLEHERAHLRGHHHLIVGCGGVLASAFPRIRLFAEARESTARLMEMRADDVAARRWGRRPVAEALFALADGTVPSIGLAASGCATVQRVERLLSDGHQQAEAPIARAARTGVSVLTVGLLAATPALLAVVTHAALCLL